MCFCTALKLRFVLPGVISASVMHCVLTTALTANMHCNFCYFSAWKFSRKISTRCITRSPRKLCLYDLRGLWYPRICYRAKAISAPEKCIICPFKFKALRSPKKPQLKRWIAESGFMAFFSVLSWPKPPLKDVWKRIFLAGFFTSVLLFFYPTIGLFCALLFVLF